MYSSVPSRGWVSRRHSIEALVRASLRVATFPPMHSIHLVSLPSDLYLAPSGEYCHTLDGLSDIPGQAEPEGELPQGANPGGTTQLSPTPGNGLRVSLVMVFVTLTPTHLTQSQKPTRSGSPASRCLTSRCITDQTNFPTDEEPDGLRSYSIPSKSGTGRVFHRGSRFGKWYSGQ